MNTRQELTINRYNTDLQPVDTLSDGTIVAYNEHAEAYLYVLTDGTIAHDVDIHLKLDNPLEVK